MVVVQPRRVWLDTWGLIDLAHGKNQRAGQIIASFIDKGEVLLIITYDQVEEFCGSTNRRATVREAAIIDALHPMWLPPEAGIYHREAYAEYRHLVGQTPLPPMQPTPHLAEAVLQWVRDCPVSGPVAKSSEKVLAMGRRKTFAEEVGYTYACEDIVPKKQKIDKAKTLFCESREWARDRGLTELEWDNFFRNQWIKCLAEEPGCLPLKDVLAVHEKATLSRMPAWETQLMAERAWHKDKGAKAKQGDLADVYHLSVLPYVHYYLADAHVASLVGRARLSTAHARVFDSIDNLADSIA